MYATHRVFVWVTMASGVICTKSNSNKSTTDIGFLNQEEYSTLDIAQNTKVLQLCLTWVATDYSQVDMLGLR